MTARSLRMHYGIHKWASLVCTGFLLVLCLTGLPLIFHDELSDWLDDPLAFAGGPGSANLDAIVSDAQVRRPGDFIQFLTRDEERPVWAVTFGATRDAVENSATYLYDATSGTFLKNVPVRQGLIHLLLTLHVELFAGLPGTLFVGVMGLLFIASVASGVVVYGPFMRKLPFGTVRYDGSPRLTWLDLHNVLGIVTVMWALAVGGTGVINTLARPLVSLWQVTELAEMTKPWAGRPVPVAYGSLDEAAAVAQAAEPDLALSSVAFPGTSFAGPHHYAFFMRGQTALTARLLKPVLVEASTLALTEARELPWYLTVLLLSQPLHFGDYGGLPLKILWALLDLITIGVLISGLYLWWTKRNLPAEQLFGEADPDQAITRGAQRRVVSR